jgi:hypothetical protein
MSFNASAAFDKSKMNLKPKCFYLMNVIKHEFPKLWESFQAEFTALTPEHSWDFYQKLLHAYHDAKTVKPEPKKTHLKVVKAEPKKVAPKAKAKAKAKAPAKKKATDKKPAAKKKVTAKKPPAKKPAAKKPTAKKKVVAKKK